MTDIKVAYLIVMRSFPGLLKQVDYDRSVTEQLEGFEWEHFTFLDHVNEGEPAEQLPMFFRGVFGRKLFAWLWLLKNARRYDFVIMRHMEFDPFSPLFAWFVRNRISVHHAKEVEELRVIRNNWKGMLASWVERFCGAVAVRTTTAILCMTGEIIEYQKSARNLPKEFPAFIFPNGVVLEDVPLIDDRRSQEGAIELGFMAGSFAPWHGLDLLLDALIGYAQTDAKQHITLHLIGNLNPEQQAQAEKATEAGRRVQVIMHGRMTLDEYRRVFAKCHLGIGSLAMWRGGVEQGATLKVREMLAMGLPIFSGHIDTALPEDFPYYVNEECSMENLIDFASRMRDVDRETVRETARPFIDKQIWMHRLAKFLQILHEKRN